MNRPSFSLRLGAVSPPMYEQLKHHGVTEKEAKVFQDDNSALNRAYIRGFLTDAEVKRARGKLAQAIFIFVQRIYEERKQPGPLDKPVTPASP